MRGTDIHGRAFCVSSIETVQCCHTEGCYRNTRSALLGNGLKDARSRFFARGCWPGSVMFVEIESSMNTGDICSAQFNHMPLLLPLPPDKVHRFSTTSLSLARLFPGVLMQTVTAFEAEPGRQRLEGRNRFKSELPSF